MRLWMPTGVDLPAFRLVHVQPDWGPEGERPVHEQVFTEGVLRWYGTGTAVAELTGMPITLRMPFNLIRGRLAWCVPKAAREECVMALRKVQQASSQPGASGPGVEDAAAFPMLLEYLTATRYPTGEPREPACLIVVADASGWRGCVSDKDNQRTMWKTATTVEGLLLTIEQALQEDDPGAWRQAASAKKWKGKRS